MWGVSSVVRMREGGWGWLGAVSPKGRVVGDDCVSRACCYWGLQGALLQRQGGSCRVGHRQLRALI